MGAVELLNTTGVTAIVSGVTSLFMWFYQERKKAKEENNAQIIALRIILEFQIKKLANEYIERGYITLEEYEDLQRMNKVYHDSLNGNGYIKHCMELVDKLPTKAPTELKGA
ncbi:hypothetical protein [Butyrivibrio virus Bo-Finn]|nr:hypothetical protein [Butyrivibrio virus Bo-Finn]